MTAKEGQVPEVESTVDPSVTTPVEPETFDRAYVEKLRKENAALRVKHKEREEREAAEQGRSKELAEQREKELQAERADKKRVEIDALRVRVGSKYGLPDALIDRLRGETPEELEADANALLPLVSSKPKAPNLGADTLPAAKKTSDDEALTPDQQEYARRVGEDPSELARWTKVGGIVDAVKVLKAGR